ncbi:PD-(D/E)XK nuclease-like domain-containing protein [Winkia sp. UMB0889B]|uniref:PD-(D/E)XK nuclease-like domain-containing protein n=1 Tax=Winkia sp. UMB0889B TaxID=3046315 RepID=UPI0025543C75|nr:PD-(D/E)XK nuclease-like domain-containing protein [Winkia sp. UMB0889B]MDK7904846.1 PD-(D/E)XK nuclease-like domain-containing protein [Winkia sp. UMB0889B]
MSEELQLPPKPGIYPNIPNSEYHADTKSLSSSGAKLLVAQGGPARFKARLENPPAPSEALLFGTAAHAYILEGVKPEVFTKTKTLTSKAAQEKIKELGDTPLVTSEGWERLQAMREAVLANPLAARLLQAKGKAEQSIYWQHPHGALLRCRPDWLPDEEDSELGFLPIVDLKTTSDATPAGFRRSCFQLGYHQSAAWYATGLAGANISTNARMVFIAVEKTPPYLVGVYTPSEEALRVGAALNEKAISIWQRCRLFDEWPGLSSGIKQLDIKPYEIPANISNELGETWQL